jgi:hypothetical protein
MYTLGTTANWRIVAVYPDGPYQRPLSNLNEGFLISGLRLALSRILQLSYYLGFYHACSLRRT